MIKLTRMDAIIITLVMITLALVFLLYNANNSINLMIDLVKEYCYIAPKPTIPFNFTRIL